MSTGMSTLEEIDAAVKILNKHSCNILLCIVFPHTDPKDLNLKQ